MSVATSDSISRGRKLIRDIIEKHGFTIKKSDLMRIVAKHKQNLDLTDGEIQAALDDLEIQRVLKVQGEHIILMQSI